MGRDKALLPHPQGGTWLERGLMVLLQLELPVTLLSRHPCHLELARALRLNPSGSSAVGPQNGSSDSHGFTEVSPPPQGRAISGQRQPDSAPARATITALAEPPPWEGPLLALHRLMQRYPGQRLLLCPVDMPDLTITALRTLLDAATTSPERIHLAHDGELLQPLLGLYPSSPIIRATLAEAVARGERRLQSWLATQACETVRLDPQTIRNVNHPPQDGSEGLPMAERERQQRGRQP